MIIGKRKFTINKNVEIGIFKNGMHYAEIKDDNGIIESCTIRRTSQEIQKWLDEQGIK